MLARGVAAATNKDQRCLDPNSRPPPARPTPGARRGPGRAREERNSGRGHRPGPERGNLGAGMRGLAPRIQPGVPAAPARTLPGAHSPPGWAPSGDSMRPVGSSRGGGVVVSRPGRPCSCGGDSAPSRRAAHRGGSSRGAAAAAGGARGAGRAAARGAPSSPEAPHRCGRAAEPRASPTPVFGGRKPRACARRTWGPPVGTRGRWTRCARARSGLRSTGEVAGGRVGGLRCGTRRASSVQPRLGEPLDFRRRGTGRTAALLPAAAEGVSRWSPAQGHRLPGPRSPTSARL